MSCRNDLKQAVFELYAAKLDNKKLDDLNTSYYNKIIKLEIKLNEMLNQQSNHDRWHREKNDSLATEIERLNKRNESRRLMLNDVVNRNNTLEATINELNGTIDQLNYKLECAMRGNFSNRDLYKKDKDEDHLEEAVKAVVHQMFEGICN